MRHGITYHERWAVPRYFSAVGSPVRGLSALHTERFFLNSKFSFSVGGVLYLFATSNAPICIHQIAISFGDSVKL